MEEKVYDVEMMYIQNKGGNNYTVETTGRRAKDTKLIFSDVEGVEVNALNSLQVRNSYIQMGEGHTKVWNMRFVYPTNFKIKYTGRIVIDVI